MLIGYMRVSKADGSQVTDLQLDTLLAVGVERVQIYMDRASSVHDDRPGLENCLRALRDCDVLLVWRLDRLEPSFGHLVKTVTSLEKRRGAGLRVLTRAKLRVAQAAMTHTSTNVRELCAEIGVSVATLYRHVSLQGTREQG